MGEKSQKGIFYKVLLGIFLFLAVAYVGVTIYMGAIQKQFIFPGHPLQGSEKVIDTHCQNTENDRLIPITLPSGTKTFLRILTQPGVQAAETGPFTETAAEKPLENGEEAAAVPTSPESASGPEIAESPQTEKAGPVVTPTVLFIYGNMGCLAWCDPMLQELYKQGANVACIEWPGFGVAGGDASEQECYEAEQAAYDYLTGTEKIDPKTLYVMGHSLGTGPAADLASKNPVAGVILASGYTDIGAVAQNFYPYLPCKLVVVHRFATIKKIPSIQAPILFIHSANDTIIPYWMSEKNFEVAQKAGKNVDFLRLKEAGHDLFFDFPESPGVWERINAFIHP